MHLCSIATAADLARVRVLVASLTEHAPGAQVTVLYVDPSGGGVPDVPGADVMPLEALALDPDVVSMWQLTRDLPSLVTTITPCFLLHLLEQEAPAVLMDPSRLAVGPITEPTPDAGLGLLPRLVEPVPPDDLEPSEATLVARGVIDPGVMLVGPDSGPVLEWWAERVSADPHTPWLDLTPGLFPDRVRVERPAGWNVSAARLQRRVLERGAGRVTLQGEPVTLLDLSGFDPARPWLLDGRQTRDLRTLVSRDRVLGRLLEQYAGELIEAGHAPGTEQATYSVVDGVVVDDIVQALVRAEVLAATRGRGTGLALSAGDGGTGAVGGTNLRDWLAQPSDSDDIGGLGRYLAEFYRRRPDLHGVYPGVRSGDVTGYLDWAELVGIESDGIPRWIVEAGNRSAGRGPGAASEAAAEEPLRLVPGVEVVGFLSADLGIGQAARMLVAGLEHAGVPVSTRTYSRTSSRLGVDWTDRPAPPGTRPDTVILCINADMLPTFLREDAGAGFTEGRRVIGFWFWELDDFPSSLRPALEPLDEVWVTSSFTADVLRSATDKPVHVLPLPVHSPARSDVDVPELAASDTFTYLFVFDYLSVFQRKNPLGLVAAFCEAFPEPGAARLVIKTINRDKRPDHAEHLAYAIGDRPDVVVIDRYLTRDELDALMWRADCYVSLHRSEGFGFTIAEEMAIGKPVIATGYSGNMQFMTPANSRPLRYDMVRVPPDAEPYPEGAAWAEPRRGHTVTAMRRVLEDEELRTRLGEAAAATIEQHHSVEALARAAVHRLEDRQPDTSGEGVERPLRRSWLRRS